MREHKKTQREQIETKTNEGETTTQKLNKRIQMKRTI